MTTHQLFDFVLNSGILVFLGIWLLKHSVNNNIHVRDNGSKLVTEKFCAEREGRHTERYEQIQADLKVIQADIKTLMGK